VHKTCPKCHHVNAAATGDPLDECPACGVIYAKAQPRAATSAASAAAPSTPAAAPAAAALPLGQRLAGLAVLAALVGIVWVATSGPSSAPVRPLVQPQDPDIQAAAQQLVQREQAQRLADGAAADAMRDYVSLASEGTAIERCVQAYVVLLLVQRAQRQDLVAEWQRRERADCAAAGMKSSQP
jgi:predicted  nucleic acid-binding Zn-ribbon protein